mgnify:CR=1 FL=1
MFHALSKIVFFVVQPSSLLAIATAAGLFVALWTRHVRIGLRVAAAGFSALMGAGLLPVGNVLLLPLETRFSTVPAPGPRDGIAAIIMLGGFEDGWVSSARPGLAINEAAERLTEGVRLAKRLPEARLVFTGGSGTLLQREPGASLPVGRFLEEIGIAPDRIVLEGRSRNTYENATFTREFLKLAPGQRVAIVTSAYHMPRAMGVFRQVGYDAVAYPVDYRTRGADDLTRTFDRFPAGLERLDLAAKEWIGLVAYRLTGRTNALYPAP